MTQEAAKKERVAKVIEVLNKARSMELYAVHQYMNQHYNLDDLDYGEFASKIKLIAIDEMRHAEQFAERIKELGGEPNSELSSKITKGQKVMDVFPFNVKVEDDTIETYNKLLEICRTNGDSVSARLFERILDEEQTVGRRAGCGEQAGRCNEQYLFHSRFCRLQRLRQPYRNAAAFSHYTLNYLAMGGTMYQLT